MTEAQRQFLARVKSAASVAESHGVPAAVMVAQAIIESGWGKSGLAAKGNAIFGIKARNWPGKVYSGTTYELVNGQSVKFPGKNKVYPDKAAALADGCNEVTLFRAYDSFEQSIDDHAAFFVRNNRYHPCLEEYARTKDPFRFAACIHRAGYATSATYTETLHAAMRLYAAELLPGVIMPEPTKFPLVIIEGIQIPDSAKMIIENRLYLHARRTFEALGYAVDYKNETKTVTITKGDR